MNDESIFVALLPEGALAAEMLATGVTMLRKANTSDVGLFSLSFFGLSIGMERARKSPSSSITTSKTTASSPQTNIYGRGTDTTLRNFLPL